MSKVKVKYTVLSSFEVHVLYCNRALGVFGTLLSEMWMFGKAPVKQRVF